MSYMSNVVKVVMCWKASQHMYNNVTVCMQQDLVFVIT